MNTTRPILRAVAAAGALALALTLGPGCAASNAANRALIDPERTAEIEVVNPGLQKQAEIVAGRALYEDQILTGVVQVRSHEDRKQTLEYRWQWFDADDFRQGTETAEEWRTVFLDPLEEEQLTGRASAPGAIRGEFELRRSTARTDGDR